jgi:periplasmic protein CpxP/Spy
MKKSTRLQYLIVSLLLVNIIAMLFIYFRPKHNGPHPKGHLAVLVNQTLQFNEEQQVAYQQLIHNHQDAIHSLEQERFKAKTTYFQLLNLASDSIETKKALNVLKEIQGEIEKTHFDHFSAIKGLCTSEQLKAFPELTKHFSQFFSPPPMPKRKH